MQRILLSLMIVGLLIFARLTTRAMAGDDGTRSPTAAKPDASASTDPTGDIPDGIDFGAATAKTLVESLAKGISLQDKPGAWQGFQPPANRPLVKQQLDLAAQVVAKSRKLTVFVQAKIGTMEAGLVSGMAQGGVQMGGEMILRYQMSQIAGNGKVDWDKIKIIENGATAQVTIANYSENLLLARVNGKWYLGTSQEALAKDVEGTRKATGALLNVMDLIEQKVNSGQITRKNFIQEYQNIVNANMGMGQN